MRVYDMLPGDVVLGPPGWAFVLSVVKTFENVTVMWFMEGTLYARVYDRTAEINSNRKLVRHEVSE